MQLAEEREMKTGIALDGCSTLEIRDLSYRYNENKVLEDINLEARKGQWLSL